LRNDNYGGIIMKADSIQDSTRYIVADVHKGNIMPGNRSEMWRNIFLEPGARVIGGVWGGELQISGGNVYVDKSVYIRGSINIENESNAKSKKKINDEIEFGSVVVSPESLFIHKNAPRTRFNSDIYVGQLNLKNTIVYGNIYSSNAVLENCIVLGGVYCRGKLEITNSILFIFKTKSLKLNDNVSLLAPYSISEEQFEMEYPVKALTFYSLLNKSTNGSSGIISLDEEDVFHVKYNEIETEEEGYSLPPKVFLLSIVERILNSSNIIEQFRKNKELIEFLSYGNNIIDEYNENFRDLTRNDIEKNLWKLIEKGIKEDELHGSSRFDELVDFFKSEGAPDLRRYEKINNEDEFQKSDSEELNEMELEAVENQTVSDTQIKETKLGDDQSEIESIPSSDNDLTKAAPESDDDNQESIKADILSNNESIDNAEEKQKSDEVIESTDNSENIEEFDKKTSKENSLIKCSECGQLNDEGFEYCIACGHQLASSAEEEETEINDDTEKKSNKSNSKILCTQCGHAYLVKFTFCPECGAKN